MNCINCKTETANPKFCTRTCAAKYNNVHFPKRRIERKCTQCDSLVRTTRSKLCELHFQEWKTNVGRDRSIGEYRAIAKERGYSTSSIHVSVRLHLRNRLKDLTEKPCAHCGYEKHVELCHIKGVSEFPDSAMLSEVNSRENIVQLCPNCHWEFDNLPRSPLKA